MFEKYYESPAYGEWCRCVYGKDLKQLGCVTMDELEIFYREVSIPPDSHILDVGCGTGHISVEIATHYSSRLTGIDFDKGSIAHAKDTFSTNLAFNFIHGDGSNISFEPSTFDLICFCDSLHFARTNDELYTILDKYFVMLKSCGKLAIFCNEPVNKQVDEWGHIKNISLKSVDLIEPNKKLWRNVFSELITMSSDLRSEIPNTYERIKSECIDKLKGDGWLPRWLYVLDKQ